MASRKTKILVSISLAGIVVIGFIAVFAKSDLFSGSMFNLNATNSRTATRTVAPVVPSVARSGASSKVVYVSQQSVSQQTSQPLNQGFGGQEGYGPSGGQQEVGGMVFYAASPEGTRPQLDRVAFQLSCASCSASERSAARGYIKLNAQDGYNVVLTANQPINAVSPATIRNLSNRSYNHAFEIPFGTDTPAQLQVDVLFEPLPDFPRGVLFDLKVLNPQTDLNFTDGFTLRNTTGFTIGQILR